MSHMLDSCPVGLGWTRDGLFCLRSDKSGPGHSGPALARNQKPSKVF